MEFRLNTNNNNPNAWTPPNANAWTPPAWNPPSVGSKRQMDEEDDQPDEIFGKEEESEPERFESRQAKKREIVNTHEESIKKFQTFKLKFTYDQHKKLNHERSTAWSFAGRNYDVTFSPVEDSDWAETLVDMSPDPDAILDPYYIPSGPSGMITKGVLVIDDPNMNDDVVESATAIDWMQTAYALGTQMGVPVTMKIRADQHLEYFFAHGKFAPEYYGLNLVEMNGVATGNDEMTALQHTKDFIKTPASNLPPDLQEVMSAYLGITTIQGVEDMEKGDTIGSITPQDLVIQLHKPGERGRAYEFAKDFMVASSRLTGMTIFGPDMSADLYFGTKARTFKNQ